jgi:RNA polymerase sigma factor (sigma-70 family)
MVADSLRYPSSADVRYSGDVTGAYRLNDAVRFGGAFSFSSGAPFTRVIIPAAGAPRLGEPGEPAHPVRRPRPDGDYTGELAGWQVSAYLQLLNVLGRSNRVTYAGSFEHCSGDTLRGRCLQRGARGQGPLPCGPPAAPPGRPPGRVLTGMASVQREVEELFEAYHDAIYRYLVRLTGDTDLAADLAQETFIRWVDRKPDRQQPPRLALHRRHQPGRDHGRVRARRLTLLKDADETVAMGERTPGPDGDCWKPGDPRLVRQALDALPEKERTILLMQQEGFTHREIAEAIDVNPKSVGILLSRALLLAATGLAASTVGPWLVRQAQELFRDEPAAVAIPEPVAHAVRGSVVAFAPTGTDFVIELATGQEGGSLTLRISDTRSASARLMGSDGELDVVVLPASLRIANHATATADYEIVVPAHLRSLRVRVGNAEELVLAPAELGAGWSTVIGLRHGHSEPAGGPL